MRRPFALLVLAAVAAGCAARPSPPVARNEMVVLLPGPEGRGGALTVTHAGQRLALDHPYATARVRQHGLLEHSTGTADEVREALGATLAALPPRPVTFVLYFQGNSEEFTAESTLEIPKIFPEIARHPAPEVVVVGHTDRMGTVAYNDGLSRRRAERVRRDLVQLGIAHEGITVAGRGEREPLVPTRDEVPEPRNRRVEITVR